MNNEKYFSQYESPNIVIVPTMSCNPSSPKRRKIGNNIVVPIVPNSVIREKHKPAQDIKPNDSNVDKKDKNESYLKSPSQKCSWAANYLRSIGLDKKSSIWNRKIPRKSASQKSVVSIDLPKNTTTEATTSSIFVPKTDIEEKNQRKVTKNIVEDLNTLKDSNTKITHLVGTKNLNIKGNSKNSKPYDSTKSVLAKNPTIVKNNNTHNLSTYKKNIVIDPKKSKTISVKKNKSHDQSINLSCSDVKQSADESSNTYIEKYKNPKCSKRTITSLKNIKVTSKCEKKNEDKSKEKKKKAQNQNTETKNNAKKAKISNKTKTKEKISNNKSDLKSNKKTIKSPIKRKESKSKSCRKIKLVINLICNKNTNPLQCTDNSTNENKSGTKKCTVSNVEDFLNDFDIDEIVESLNTCGKKANHDMKSHRELNKYQSKENRDQHNVISNIQNDLKDNTDAIDLIKTLKGEEDDDLIRISTENVKELLFSNVVNNFTQRTDNSHTLSTATKTGNNAITKDLSPHLIKTKEKGKLKGFDTVLPVEKVHLDNVMVNKNIDIVQSDKTVNTNKYKHAKETHLTVMNKKEETLKHEGSRPLMKDVRTDTLELLPIELEDDLNKNNIQLKEEQHIYPFKEEPHVTIKSDSLTIFNNVDNDSYEVSKNIEENIKCDSVYKNKPTNLGETLLGQDSVKSFIDEDQNKNKGSLNHTLKENANTDNVNEKVEKSSKYVYNSNKLQTEINKGTEFTTENIHTEEMVDNLYQKKPEEQNNKYQKLDGEQNDKNEKCIKTLKNVKINDNQNENIAKTSINQEIFPQHNEKLKNKGNQTNLSLPNNDLYKEVKVSDSKVQENKHEDNTEDRIIPEISKKDKQNNMRNSNTEKVGSQKKLSHKDDVTRGNIKTKIDLEIILKLEARLHNNSGSKYSINSIIHTGKFSKVYKCKHPNGKYYALKMPTTNLMYKLGKEKKEMLYSLISDIPKNNLFIVNLVKAFNLNEKWCYLMEYYPKNLQQALDEAGKPFTIDHIQDFARQLVMAVMVLRNKNMVHLDIKPQHILINGSNNMLKLCGFDSLCYINTMKVLPNVGTVNYRAPEVILGYKSGFEIDVWGTGLVLYEMATNIQLFPGVFNNDILYKQICTLGCIPYDMLKKSQFSDVHFLGPRFIRKSGFKGQTINIISKFYKNNKLCNSIYEAYYENWGYLKSVSQQNSDIGKINLFVKLLQKMLVMHPESRLAIEFVYANPFIYDAYSY